MSKSNNNNLLPSSKRRCSCGRYISIGEDTAGIGVLSYTCPSCSFRPYSKPLTSEEYYNQFKR